MKLFFVCVLLALVCLLIEAVPAPLSQRRLQHLHARRHNRRTLNSNRTLVQRRPRLPRYPYQPRDEENSESCTPEEVHVLCGQERHCDLTCDNMYSPPHCLHNTNIPKCYFPRCQCRHGYVRTHNGHCIPPSDCPNRYMEPKEENSDITVVFKPMLPKPIGKIHSFRSKQRKLRKVVRKVAYANQS